MKNIPYEISTIDKVKKYNDGYEITYDKCIGFFLSSKYGIPPKVGDKIEVYGKMGRAIKGICINGKTAYFKGEVETENDRVLWLKKYKEKKRSEFIKDKKQLDEDYDNLPLVFQRRITILRDNNPNFRVAHETYEMLVCKEAVKIAYAFPKKEELEAFRKADYGKQKKMLPIMSNAHSGNSWGASIRLAYWYITDKEDVWKEHGALCPLVGCEDYGCWASNIKEGKC